MVIVSAASEAHGVANMTSLRAINLSIAHVATTLANTHVNPSHFIVLNVSRNIPHKNRSNTSSSSRDAKSAAAAAFRDGLYYSGKSGGRNKLEGMPSVISNN